LQPMQHPSLGQIAQMQTPLRLSDDLPPALTPAPSLGADTATLLTDRLGLSQDAIAKLAAQGAIKLASAE